MYRFVTEQDGEKKEVHCERHVEEAESLVLAEFQGGPGGQH